jgi:uncharacterized OB-fold protein
MSEGAEKPVARIIAPIPWGESGPYWEATATGELRLPRCRDTGRFFFPPAPTSPWGDHRAPEWIRVGGRGTIWSFIVAHPPLIGQFAQLAPYVSAVVELDSAPGARLVGPVVAAAGAPIGSVPAEQVQIGARVDVDLGNPDHADLVVPRWVLVRST